MRILAAILVPVIWLIATALGLAALGTSILMETAWPGYLATGLAALGALSAAALVLVGTGARAPLGAVAVGLAVLPWLVGVLGCLLALHQIDVAIAYAAPDQRALLAAMGRSEALAGRVVGGGQTAAIALALALGHAGLLLGRDTERDVRAVRVVLVAALAVALTAGASAAWAAHGRELCAAMAHAAPDQRAAVMALAGGLGPRLASGVLAVIALVSGVALTQAIPGGDRGAARATATVALVALLAAGAAFGLERVADRDHTATLEAVVRGP